MFADEKTQPPEEVEKDLKKLLTIAKSKFYMLKINFPKIFENIENEVADSTA